MSLFRIPEQHGDTVVVVAEAGVNHNGDESVAHRLIDVAASACATYVKFQTFEPDLLVAPSTASTPYQRFRGAPADQNALLRSLMLPPAAWGRLRDHAHEVGIGFMSTPFDNSSARMLVELGVDALKASSGELTNLPFLRELSKMGLPLLISSGMGSMHEVVAAVEAVRAAPSVAVFHCVSAYPAPLEDCNLRTIDSMARTLQVPVGWSDHTRGLNTAVVAAALGARLFEKHFTLDNTMTGPDHAASLEPSELERYIAAVSSVPSVLGDGVKRRMASEKENAGLVRRSWHAAKDLPQGHRLAADDLLILRPEDGVSPSIDLVGAILARGRQQGSPIRAQDLEGGAL